jgi:hypothetical protein
VPHVDGVVGATRADRSARNDMAGDRGRVAVDGRHRRYPAHVSSPSSLAPADLAGESTPAGAPVPADPLSPLLGAVPGLTTATDLLRLRAEWDR